MVTEGIQLLEIPQAGGWKSPTMPALYNRKQPAATGGAAKLAAKQGR